MPPLRIDAEPLRYDPDMERAEAGEAETGRGINAAMEQIRETTLQDGHHAIRSVHAKSHGLLQGEFEVLPDLKPVLAQGLFARPKRYPLVMRLSTIPGDLLDDSVSTPRGLAIKVIGVDGARLPGSEGAATQDFVLVNAPAFNAPSAKAFLGNLKLLAATTDRAEGAKKAISATMRGLEKLVETFGGGANGTIATLGGQPETHILGDTFYSQAPLLYGDYVAKLSVAPVSPELVALAGAPLKLKGRPDGLREAVTAFFRAHDAEWELRVQLCTDLDKMPIENAAKVWPEDESPYLPVARLRVPAQLAWSEARARVVDDGLSFSPWHGLAAHRPLGSVMRLRKAAYEQSARFRAAQNHVPVEEPETAVEVPD